MADYKPTVVTVGTSVVTLLNNSANRRIQWTVTMPTTAKVAGNTGLVYLGVGVAPNPVAGDKNAQHVLAAGDTFSETSLFADPRFTGFDVSQGTIYAVASSSGQVVEVFVYTSPVLLSNP